MHAKDPIKCPYCFADDLQPIARGSEAGGWFQIRRPFRCTRCSQVVKAPCSAALCAFTILFGFALFCAAIFDLVLPAFSPTSPADTLFRRLLNLALGIIASIGFGSMMVTAARTWRYSIWYRQTIGSTRT